MSSGGQTVQGYLDTSGQFVYQVKFPVKAHSPTQLGLLKKKLVFTIKLNVSTLRGSSSDYSHNNVVKDKVKRALVQALRVCTGRTANRGSRGIAILYRH